MDEIINLLNQSNIPYNLKDKKDNIIIIPNGVIKIKNFQTIRNNQDIIDYIKHLTKISNYYNLPIYSFFINIETINNNIINIINANIDTSRILLCYNISQIIIGEYCYAIRTTGAIWTLATNHEYFISIIQNKLIIIPMETYKRAIVIMNDNEIELLHRFNINIIETNIESNINICYITQDTFRERELFTLKINYTPLNGGNRSPCRVVEGITNICPNCNNIVYYQNGTLRKHNKCVI